MLENEKELGDGREWGGGGNVGGGEDQSKESAEEPHGPSGFTETEWATDRCVDGDWDEEWQRKKSGQGEEEIQGEWVRDWGWDGSGMVGWEKQKAPVELLAESRSKKNK